MVTTVRASLSDGLRDAAARRGGKLGERCHLVGQGAAAVTHGGEQESGTCSTQVLAAGAQLTKKAGNRHCRAKGIPCPVPLSPLKNLKEVLDLCVNYILSINRGTLLRLGQGVYLLSALTHTLSFWHFKIHPGNLSWLTM